MELAILRNRLELSILLNCLEAGYHLELSGVGYPLELSPEDQTESSTNRKAAPYIILILGVSTT